MIDIFLHRKSGRTRRLYRLAALAAVLVCICTLLFPVSVLADKKEYSVPAADFDVRIGSDGIIQVTENWTVEYEEGLFTRFYKDIYRNVPAEEEFSFDKNSVSVKIDGNECTEVFDSGERADYTYYVKEASDAYTYECYRKSEDVTRQYQITYRLTNAVKFIDKQYYLVTMRLIPASFEETVGTVTAKITTPDGSVAEIRNGKYFDQAVSEGNTVSASGRHWNGVFKVKVRIDGAEIAGAQTMSSTALTNRDDKEMDTPFVRTLKRIGLLLLGFLPGVIAVGFLLLKPIQSVMKAVAFEKIAEKLKGDSYYYFKILEKWRPRLDPIEFAFGCGKNRRTQQLFYSILGSMFYREVLQSDNGDTINVLNTEGLTGPEREVLNLLEKHGKMSDGRISMQRFRSAIDNESGLIPDFERTMKKSIQDSVKSKLSGEEFKEYGKDWKTFYTYAEYYFEKDVKTNVMTNDYWPYFMIFNDWLSPNPLANYPGQWVDDYGILLADYYNTSNNAYSRNSASSSDSGGSSCSSCSSCSGCGGGGAD